MSEIRLLAERVKELRQELESVEARLRELSLGDGDGGGAPIAPLETVDSPTVLTTDHAQRRARADRMMPMIAATFAVVVLAGGIGIGYVLSSPAAAPAAAAAPPAAPVTTPAVPETSTAPASTDPISPPPAETASAAPVTSATVPPALPGTTTAAVASPIAPAPVVPPPRRNNVDRGF